MSRRPAVLVAVLSLSPVQSAPQAASRARVTDGPFELTAETARLEGLVRFATARGVETAPARERA